MITPRHSNDKCFHRAGGDSICQFAHHISNVSECQSLHDSDTVKSSKLKNVRWKLNICLLRRHLYTIQWHMTTLWYRSWLFGSFAMTPIAVMNRIFHSEMAVTARACGTCTQFKTKHQSKHQRVLPAYMALHKIVGYLTVITNVFGFYSHWKV